MCVCVSSQLFIACYMTQCVAVWYLCMNWLDHMTCRSAILLDVIAVSALIIYVSRVALGYKQTWDRYQVSSRTFTVLLPLNPRWWWWRRVCMGWQLSLDVVLCIIYLSPSYLQTPIATIFFFFLSPFPT